MSLTKQEMFDRAYRGLASQGWKRAVGPRGCSYLTDDGLRCAWGWVDTSLGSDAVGAVDSLSIRGRGLAAELDDDAITFAADLQSAHDGTSDGHLKASFHSFAARHSLSIPELP